MSEKEKPCMACKKACVPHQKDQLKSWLSDLGGTVFSSVNPRPNSKYHTVIMTKRHTEDLRTLTSQEWADILPVLKDSIAKIENYYKTVNKLESAPRGYRLTVPNGDLSGANQPPHFYMRVVPKYKKDWGTVAKGGKNQSSVSAAFKEAQQKFYSALQPNTEGVINQTNKLVVKLHDEMSVPAHTRENLVGAIAISTKAHLPNDINAIDQATWNEIGQMLQELMKKIEAGTDCRDFVIEIRLGKEAAEILREENQIDAFDYPDSEFVVVLTPKHKKTIWWDGTRPIGINNLPVGTMENERIAEKLRDPEAYFKEWGKNMTSSIRRPKGEAKFQVEGVNTQNKGILWKQPALYWGIGIGLGIAGLGFLVYNLVRKKK